MHNLGRTRSSQQPNHVLLTPDTFVRTALPGMKGCTAIVHAGPAMGARFTEYTAEFEARGEMVDTRAQRFIFVLEGVVKVETPDKQSKLRAGGYAYAPAPLTHRITATEPSRVVVIEKSYESLAGAAPPHLIVSHEDKVVSHPLADDPALQVKCLLPDEMSFDFAVNIMAYQPGAALRHGRNARDGARPHHARRRRHLPARGLLVSGHGWRFHLDGTMVPTMVRRDRKGSREVSHLQRLEPASADGQQT
jgi:(S)-ureidoglycine aminohydrolase